MAEYLSLLITPQYKCWYIELKLNYLYVRPYSQIRPYGSALWSIKFGLPVSYHSAFRIQPNGPTSNESYHKFEVYYQVYIYYITCRVLLSRYYTSLLFGHVVMFFSAVQFSIYSAVRIRLYDPVKFESLKQSESF